MVLTIFAFDFLVICMFFAPYICPEQICVDLNFHASKLMFISFGYLNQVNGCIIRLSIVEAIEDCFSEESHWSNVNSSVLDVLLLSTGLGIQYVLSAWITRNADHILTPMILATHHTCTYGCEQYPYVINKNSHNNKGFS